MTITEVLVLVGGLALGYWLVSVFIPNVKRAPNSVGTPPRDEHEGTSFTSTDAGLGCYEILGIPDIATREQVASAYKLKISQYHPDKVATMAPEIRHLAQLRSSQINVAYDEAMKRFAR